MSSLRPAKRAGGARRAVRVTGTIGLRHALRPGDVGAVVSMHGLLYAREYGFDSTFEAYVASPLAEFVMRGSSRERLWLAERDGTVVGSIAIVDESEQVGQLRWFLVAPEARRPPLSVRWLRARRVDTRPPMGSRRRRGEVPVDASAVECSACERT